jgi:hypothetical protein
MVAYEQARPWATQDEEVETYLLTGIPLAKIPLGQAHQPANPWSCLMEVYKDPVICTAKIFAQVIPPQGSRLCVEHPRIKIGDTLSHKAHESVGSA